MPSVTVRVTNCADVYNITLTQSMFGIESYVLLSAYDIVSHSLVRVVDEDAPLGNTSVETIEVVAPLNPPPEAVFSYKLQTSK